VGPKPGRGLWFSALEGPDIGFGGSKTWQGALVFGFGGFWFLSPESWDPNEIHKLK
jgi:hypothetical protein